MLCKLAQHFIKFVNSYFWCCYNGSTLWKTNVETWAKHAHSLIYFYWHLVASYSDLLLGLKSRFLSLNFWPPFQKILAPPRLPSDYHIAVLNSTHKSRIIFNYYYRLCKTTNKQYMCRRCKNKYIVFSLLFMCFSYIARCPEVLQFHICTVSVSRPMVLPHIINSVAVKINFNSIVQFFHIL